MAGQVRVRLHGLPDDVEKMSIALSALMNVLEISRDYQDNGKSQFVRRYLTVAPEPPASAPFPD